MVMTRKFYLNFTFVSILILSITLSCQPTPQLDLEKERNTIIALHELQREVHFEKDSIGFANLLSDNFISVNRGEISHPSKEELISRYHGYFSSVDFIRWDDVSEPIIKFSDDGRLAYTIVDKVVELSTENLEGETVKDTTYFAWTAIYKKYPTGWKIDCVATTNK